MDSVFIAATENLDQLNNQEFWFETCEHKVFHSNALAFHTKVPLWILWKP